jgi:hypothetical protein
MAFPASRQQAKAEKATARRATCNLQPRQKAARYPKARE